MNAYPIGNDLTVKWSLLYSDGSEFPLNMYDFELSYRTSRGTRVVDSAALSVSGNVLTWHFHGDSQAVTGRYTLGLKITLSGDKIVELQQDNAFLLSSVSEVVADSYEIALRSYCDTIDLTDAVAKASKAMDMATIFRQESGAKQTAIEAMQYVQTVGNYLKDLEGVTETGAEQLVALATGKADKSDTYTKTEVNTELAKKADKTELVLDDKIDFYSLASESEQTAAGYGTGKFIYKSGTINTASGNVVVCFPLNGMKKLKYRAYLSGATYIAVALKTAFANNYQNIVKKSDIPSEAGWQEGEIDLTLYPTATYAMFSTKTSSASYRSGSYCVLTNEGFGTVVSGVKDDVKANESNIAKLDTGLSVDGGIFAYNGKEKWKTRIAQLHREMSLTSGKKYTGLVLGCFTDVHDCAETLPRYREFFDYFSTANFSTTGDSKAYLDDVIHLGDTVKDSLADGYPNWTANAAQSWLNVAGNHEYYTDSSKTVISTAAQVRGVLIDGNESVWNTNGVVTVSGKNYWYKDYAEKRIRLISIDVGNWTGSFDSEQRTWLSARLTEALSLVDPNNSSNVGYSVIIATHIAPKGKTLRNHPWCNLKSSPDLSSEVYFGDQTSINSNLVPIVSDFIDNGGKFVCYLAGHVHNDYIGFAVDDPRQLIVVQSMSTLDKHRDTFDRRMESSSTEDCINIVGVNVVTASVVFARVGYHEDKYLRKIDTFCYNYSKREFVDIPAIDSDVVHKTGEETLSGKTLENCSADFSDLTDTVSGKNLEEILAEKEDSGYTYTREEIDSALAGKVDGTSYQSDKTSMNSAIASKASDSNVVHKTGNETISGAKSFDDAAHFDDGFTTNNDIDLGGNQLKEMGTPTESTDGATKGYVDDKIGDLSDLETTDKSSIVNAINEARQSGGGGSATPVVDNLTSDSTTSALSAKQGKVLKGLVDGKATDSDVVHKTGDETISGTKTFNNSTYAPQYSFPLGDGEEINLIGEYDEESGDVILNVGGSMGDSILRAVAYPISDNDGANKAYVDTKADKIVKVSMGTSFQAGKIFKLGEISGAKTFSLIASDDDYAEYMIEFSTGATPPSITWNITGLKWAGGTAPTINANKTYFVSIVDNLAVIGEF